MIEPVDIDNSIVDDIIPIPVTLNETATATTTSTDSITGWEVKISVDGKATKVTFSDGVEYGTDNPAFQILAGKPAMTLAGLAGLSGLGYLGDASGIRAESDVKPESLSIDLKIPSSSILDLEGRLWAEGHARVPKKSPTVAKGFTVNRVILGIHGEIYRTGIEVLVAFDPIINANGKGKSLSIQKLTDLVNSENINKLAKYLKPTALFTDNRGMLESGYGIDTSGFSRYRTDVLTSDAARTAFPIRWDTTGLFA